ncbi:hypothetical protein ACIHQR_10360 [Corallococcus coralloides]|uniref:hypothetical protein n=1 Tax=Corallococcus coralloides TaxID=184914 RepID=UPI00384B386C
MAGWLFRSWAGARIKNEVDIQYSQRLETHKSNLRIESEREIEINKSKLKSESDTAIERFRADIADQRAIHGVASSALNAAISAGAERRLKAIDSHWKSMLQGRNLAQKLMFPYDALKREEIENLFDKGDSSPLKPIASENLEAFEKLYSEAYDLRPFIDDLSWTYFYSHQIFLGRLLALIFLGFRTNKLTYWLDDPFIISILRPTLTQDEYKAVEGAVAGGITQAIGLIEHKFINSVQETISGRALSDSALKQARQFSEKLSTTVASSGSLGTPIPNTSKLK